MFKILVDADACPNVIKQIIFRASKRLNIPCILIANHPMAIPASPLISFMQVSQGFDVADDEIERQVQAGDIVITGDIPLADKVIEKKASAINPRGFLYTKDNIKEKLDVRNFMDEMRGAGQVTGGPKPLNKKDQQSFANALDRLLARKLSK